MKLQVLIQSFILLSCAIFGNAFPKGRLIALPPRPTDTALKRIPDEDHPFQPPGPTDLRGPCPGLNTLANHGYLPRNGIATFEQVVEAVMEGFNMDYDVAIAATAFGMLTRGNSYTNQISIGGPSPHIPPLPRHLDGNVTRGLATHGRFEGDNSMTRYDFNIGDNVNFSQELFDEYLEEIAIHGNDSDVTGPKSVVSYNATAEFKYRRFLESQAQNPGFELHAGRWTFSIGEAAFTMTFFPNGTDNVLSIPTLTSFFRDQHFPDNWHRHSGPVDSNTLAEVIGPILLPHLILPGANVNGEYVEDGELTGCSAYNDFLTNAIPRTLLDARGLLKKNVDTLLEIIHSSFGTLNDCERVDPAGEPGV